MNIQITTEDSAKLDLYDLDEGKVIPPFWIGKGDILLVTNNLNDFGQIILNHAFLHKIPQKVSKPEKFKWLY